MNTSKLYGIATIRSNQVRFRCGTKFIRFAHNVPQPHVVKNKCIEYKNMIYDHVLDETNNKYQIFISFNESDIVFETMKTIEITNCQILNKVFESKKMKTRFVFDKDMNLFPVLKNLNQTVPGSLSTYYKFIIVGDGDEYIEIIPRDENWEDLETNDVLKNLDIIKVGNINLSNTEILEKFEQSKILTHFSHKISFSNLSKFYPVYRIFYLNWILYERFKNAYKISNESPTPCELEVIDLSELKDVQVLNRSGEINIFKNCVIWDIKKYNIEEYQEEDINNFKFETEDKIYYLVIPLDSEYEWLHKCLKGYWLNYKCYDYLVLIQISKKMLDEFKTTNILEKLSGRTRINNNRHPII